MTERKAFFEIHPTTWVDSMYRFDFSGRGKSGDMMGMLFGDSEDGPFRLRGRTRVHVDREIFDSADPRQGFSSEFGESCLGVARDLSRRFVEHLGEVMRSLGCEVGELRVDEFQCLGSDPKLMEGLSGTLGIYMRTYDSEGKRKDDLDGIAL